MAQRRMIAKAIYEADRFTDLSATARLLYTYMCLNADDDGMLTNVKQLLFLTTANNNDLKKLVETGYLIKFDSGVYVIRHWLQMNKVQATRKVNTNYIDELSQLQIGNDNTYNLCQQNVDNLSEQYSKGQYQGSLVQDSTEQGNTGKVSKGKVSKEKVDDSDCKQNGNDITLFLQNKQFKKIHELYSEKISKIRNPKEYETLYNLINEYPLSYVAACIDFMATKEGKSVNYLKKICLSHESEIDEFDSISE